MQLKNIQFPIRKNTFEFRNFSGLQYAPKTLPVTCPFNGTAHFVPFSFMISLFSVRTLFVICSISVERCLHFPSDSNTFYIVPCFTICLHVQGCESSGFYPNRQILSYHCSYTDGFYAIKSHIRILLRAQPRLHNTARALLKTHGHGQSPSC